MRYLQPLEFLRQLGRFLLIQRRKLLLSGALPVLRISKSGSRLINMVLKFASERVLLTFEFLCFLGILLLDKR